MRLLTTAFVVLCALAWPFPGDTQWTRTTVNGEQACVDTATGVVRITKYLSKQFAIAACNVMNDIEVMIGGSLIEAQQALLFPVMPPQPDIPAPPAGWQSATFNGSTNPLDACPAQIYDSGAGEFTVGALNGGAWGADDSYCAFSYDGGTTTDLTLTVRVTQADQIAEIFNKGGIGARASLNDDAAAVLYTVYNVTGRVIDSRATTAGATENIFFDPTAVSIPACLRIELDRAVQLMGFYFAANCADYTLDHVESVPWAASGNSVHLVQGCAADDQGFTPPWTCAYKFKDVVVSTSDVNLASPSSGGLTQSTYSIPETSTPLTVTWCRTGSGDMACAIDWSLTPGTAAAGTNYTNVSGGFDYVDDEVGCKTADVPIIDVGTVNGDRTFTFNAVEDSCPGDTLGILSATVTIADTDGAGFFSTQTPSYTPVIDGLSGDGLDWDAYFATSPAVEWYQINNLNTSGAGSLQGCFAPSAVSTTLRICVVSVGGLVDYPAGSEIISNRDNLILAGWTAPGEGFGYSGAEITISNGSQRVLIANIFSVGKDFPAGTPGAPNVGRCFNADSYDGAAPVTDVVLLNFTCIHNSDQGIAFYRLTDRWTMQDSALLTPLHFPFEGSVGREGLGVLLGAAGSSTIDAEEGSMIRNIITHFNGRCPTGASPTMLFANNLCYNGLSEWSSLHGPGNYVQEWNLVDNVYVTGPSATTALPIRFFSDITNTLNAYVNGNCTLGGSFNDSSQTNLIEDEAGANSVLSGSLRSTAVPDGFVRTAINGGAGCNDAAEEQMAQAIMGMNGVFPQARDPWVQQFYDHIQNAMDGAGGTGGFANDTTTYGQPSIANAACNLSTAGSCRTGLPALPVNPAAAGSPFNAGLEYVNAARCLALPAGAPGC